MSLFNVSGKRANRRGRSRFYQKTSIEQARAAPGRQAGRTKIAVSAFIHRLDAEIGDKRGPAVRWEELDHDLGTHENRISAQYRASPGLTNRTAP
jgi:hypothetical protein